MGFFSGSSSTWWPPFHSICCFLDQTPMRRLHSQDCSRLPDCSDWSALLEKLTDTPSTERPCSFYLWPHSPLLLIGWLVFGKIFASYVIFIIVMFHDQHSQKSIYFNYFIFDCTFRNACMAGIFHKTRTNSKLRLLFVSIFLLIIDVCSFWKSGHLLTATYVCIYSKYLCALLFKKQKI